MYKAVNLSEETYTQLQKLATQLNKPKAQVVATLIANYDRAIKEQGKKELESFNKEMGAKIDALTLSKKISIDTSTMDADFSALADTDSIR